MTALAMDVRDLSLGEIDEVAGGPFWMVVAAPFVAYAAYKGYQNKKQELELQRAEAAKGGA